MAIEELVNVAPKSIRPALWVIAFSVTMGAIAVGGMSAIETKAALAATQATSPIVERVSKLEGEQSRTWAVMGEKLDSISAQLTQTRQDVAVLSQKIEDGRGHK